MFVGEDEIICTNEHPFYSPIKGWTAACDLRAGDILVTVNGEYVVVEKIQHEILESPVKVYNFEVEGFHTYFVGSGDGILVHNECKPKSPKKLSKDYENRINAHRFKEEVLKDYNRGGTPISRFDIYVDTSNNSVWLNNKNGSTWLDTFYFLEELFENFPKMRR